MQAINKVYVKNIKETKKIRVFIKKDKSGKCYLKVEGRDYNTILIVRSDDSKTSDYFGIEGYKVKESELARILDIIQKEKLEKSGVAKRFIKEELPEIDLYEEMDIETFLNKCKEIEKRQNEPNTTLYFEEPENIGERKIKRALPQKESKERIHSVVPYELRKEELIKHKPKMIIKMKGTKTEKEFDAYVYTKNGYILAIVEPTSGLGYQYNLNLGFASDYNKDKIIEMIKAALEAKEDIVMEDDAIIRKNHTTIESFKENIEIFLNNKGNDKSFINKSELASTVYGKTRK